LNSTASPAAGAGVGLGCAGEERGDAAGGAQDERDPEHADQADEGGVGEFVAHAPGLPLVHVSRRTASVPEMRPNRITSCPAVGQVVEVDERAGVAGSGGVGVGDDRRDGDILTGHEPVPR
jgi:hypothetical protein